MSITIENKAGVADKFKGAQSIPGGSKLLKNVKEAGKKGLNFLKSHKKEIAACLVFAAGVGLLASAVESPVNIDGNRYEMIAKYGSEYYKTLAKVAFSGPLILGSLAAGASKLAERLQGNSSNTANVQAKANTGR